MQLKYIPLFLLLIPGANLFAQSTARVDSFYMASLGRTKKFEIFLPQHYNPATRYPILYLLHGLGGTYENWPTQTNIAEYLKNVPLIVVMPDGENSWYVNSVAEPQDRFEEYIVSELPQYIQKLYSVDTTKQAIAGNSMGGYGALMLALKYPSHYRFAGGLSSPIAVPRQINDAFLLGDEKRSVSLRKAFGDKANASRKAHDIFYLYKQSPKTALPYLYMAVGIQDDYERFVQAHHAFTDLLRIYGAAYEYHEAQGGHDWKFWDSELQPMIARMRDVMKF